MSDDSEVWEPSESCPHHLVVPCVKETDDSTGIVWGRCVRCGDESFPIYDPDWGDGDAETHSSLRDAGFHIEKLEDELSLLRRTAYEFGWTGDKPPVLGEWLRAKLEQLERRKP